LLPTVKPAKAQEDRVVLSLLEVWVVQHMAMAPQVPQVIGESEAPEAMAHFTVVAVAVAVTTVVAVAVQMLTLAAPTPAAAVADLHTPTHLL
jgi:hypothetical protein